MSYSAWLAGQQTSIDNFRLDCVQTAELERLNFGDSILEIGCGTGLFLKELNQRGFSNVTGLDVDSTLARYAGKLSGITPTTVEADRVTSWLKSNKSAFDSVFLFDVLEHIPVALQAEFAEALLGIIRSRPAGSILIRVPNASSPSFGWMRHIDFTHTSAFTQESLSFLFADDSFELKFFPAHLGVSDGWKKVARGLAYKIGSCFWRCLLFGYIGPKAFKLIDTPNIYCRIALRG